MRERMRFESEIQDLQLGGEAIYREYDFPIPVADAAEQLKAIFLEQFSFKKRGARLRTPYGAKLGTNVVVETVADKDWPGAWKTEVKKRTETLEKIVLKFAPELIRDKLVDYYKVLRQPLPSRLKVIDENTKLDRDERAVLFSLIKVKFLQTAEKEAATIEGFYSLSDQKLVMKNSTANIAVLAHEMAHAYADKSWHDFITMMTLRGMKDTSKLDEGMATLMERAVVDAWIKKQKDKSLTAPPAAYDKTYTDQANEFIKLVTAPVAYEAYFGGEVDFTDNNKPEDTLVLGKSREKWQWKWR